MGLFQDQTSSLSEIKRLAALVMDPSRRDEIGPDQWPLAMIAYGLVTCNEKNRQAEGIEIYRPFQSCCAPDARKKCALQLAAFIRQRKGDGWRALLPFAMTDELADIRRQAAFLIYTLAAPEREERFPGIAGLADIICAAPLPGQAGMSPALDALLADRGEPPCPHGARLGDLLRRPRVSYDDLAPFDPERPALSREIVRQVEISVKYAGYIERQNRQVEEMRKLESHPLPPDVDYQSIQGLRLEARQKLSQIRPLNLGQASRISGVSPADVAVLMVYLKQREGK